MVNFPLLLTRVAAAALYKVDNAVSSAIHQDKFIDLGRNWHLSTFCSRLVCAPTSRAHELVRTVVFGVGNALGRLTRDIGQCYPMTSFSSSCLNLTVHEDAMQCTALASHAASYLSTDSPRV